LSPFEDHFRLYDWRNLPVRTSALLIALGLPLALGGLCYAQNTSASAQLDVQISANVLVSEIANPQILPQSKAARMVGSCDFLKSHSPSDWAKYCQDNPALAWAVRSQSGHGGPETPQPGVSGQARPEAGSGDLESPAADAAPIDELRQAAISEIVNLGRDWANAAARGSLAKRVLLEGELRVLYGDFRRSLDASVPLPSDPLYFAEPGALRDGIEDLRARRRQIAETAALLEMPDSAISLDSLDGEIARLNAIASDPAYETFHKARDSLELRFSPAAWKQLGLTRRERIAATQQSLFTQWKAKYPDSELASIPSFSTLRKQIAGGPPAGGGSDVLETYRSYWLDPGAWLSNEARLNAEFAKVRKLQNGPRDFHRWKASLLSDSDLRDALLFGKTLQAGGPGGSDSGAAIAGLPPGSPIAAGSDYWAQELSALEAEHEMRKTAVRAHGPRAPNYDPGLEASSAVNLATLRWSDRRFMPPSVRQLYDAGKSAALEAYAKRVVESYRQLTELQNAEVISGSSSPAARQTLQRASTQFRNVVDRFEAVRAARKAEGVNVDLPWQNQAALVATEIGLQHSANAPTAGPPLATTDPLLEGVLQGLANSIHEARLISPKAIPPEYAPSSSLSERRLYRAQALRDDPKVEIVPEVPRQEVLKPITQSFKNPRTGAPPSFEETISGKDIRLVPGGVVLGATAVPKPAPSPLSSYILRYDAKTKSLVMRGTDGAFAYPVEPETLKTLLRYVASRQSIAVSIGHSMSRTHSYSFAGQAVHLQSELVDTRVGQDVVEADSIPWAFDRVQPELDGYAAFARAFTQAHSRIPDQVRALMPGLSTAGSVQAEDKFEANEYASVLRNGSGCIPRDGIDAYLGEYGDGALPVITLALLYDSQAEFALSDGRIQMTAKPAYKYLKSRVEVRGSKICMNDGLGRDAMQTIDLDDLESLVNGNIGLILRAFPAVSRTMRHAALAAFLRWAVKPGNLIAADFSQLANVKTHDVAHTPTADMIVE
jgi:hypothetical protein